MKPAPEPVETPRGERLPVASFRARRTGNPRFDASPPESRFPDPDRLTTTARTGRARRRAASGPGRRRRNPRVPCAGWRIRSRGVVPGTRGSRPVRRRPDSPIVTARSARARNGAGVGSPAGAGSAAKEPPRVSCAGRRIRSGGVVPGIRGSRPVRRRPDSGIMTARSARARNGVGVGSPPGAGSAAKEPPRVSCAGRRIRSGGVVPGIRGSRPVRRRPDSAIVTARSARARRRPERPGLRRGCPAVRRHAGAGRAPGRPRDRAETGGNAGLRAPAGRFVRGARFREDPVQGRFAGIPVPRP